VYPNIKGVIDDVGSSMVTFRYLSPDEGGVLSEAIRAAYGDTYDVRWVYDPDEVSARIAAGAYVSWVAESTEGELLCHEGMSLAAAGDAVGHSGQAVTMPAARGQHLFTRTKQHLMDWAAERGLAGMYSEATAAHPYSQRANLELGAHETGFLLGWSPVAPIIGVVLFLGAAFGPRMNPLVRALSEGRASPQQRLDFCNMVDERIALTQSEHQERLKYIKADCDRFDWFNSGTTEAKRLADHQDAMDQLSDQISNLFDLRRRFCP